MLRSYLQTIRQYKANTKIALQIKHATLTNPGPVVVRSHSGDTDITVLLMALFADTDQTIYLDNGHDNHRKVLDLGSCEMTIPMKKALSGLHAFFKKGKKTRWSILQKYPQFLDVFMELGTDWEPNEHIIAQLEEYVCKLFGQKKVRCVSIARQQIFWEKYDKDNRISDLSLLPPYKDRLHLHIQRAYYVCRLWKLSCSAMVMIPTPTLHGWTENMDVMWVAIS